VEDTGSMHEGERFVEPEESHDALGFERLVATLSATFVGLPADAVDAHGEHALGHVAEFLNLDRSTVGQPSPEDGRLRVTHQWVRPGCQGTPFVVEDDLPWLVPRIRGGETTVIERLDDLPPDAWRERDFLERTGTRSQVTLPLVVGGAVVGGVGFGALRRERRWPPALVERLRLVAEIVGSALARKQADLALRRGLAFERLVADLSARFVDLPPDVVDGNIERVLEDVAQFLGVDRATVLQRTRAEGSFVRTHQWVREGFPRIGEAETEETYPWLIETVIRRREPVVFGRRSELPATAERDRARLERYGIHSAVTMPLAVGGTVLGALGFASHHEGRSWSPELLERLRLVAEVVANALARQNADRELRAALAENQRLRERLEAENVYLQEEVKEARDFGDIVGQSAALRAVLQKVDQVAPTDAPVLLLGETGTGKELLARAIHARSGRRQGPLIAVNCAALPTTLIESELFGHEKGAFTGATQAKPGRFELADGGTLFLDEIGDLDPTLQTKLLRILQDGEIQRLGSTKTRKVDVRIVAATNRELAQDMREGRFRTDLYYRLGVFPIQIPPLRERREDIPLLAWYLIQSRQRGLGRAIEKIPRAAMDALVAYDWPGNVRELQNVIDRALILSPGSILRVDEALGTARATRGEGRPAAAPETLEDAERAHILGVLERCRWVLEGRGQAADRLGLRPSTLRNRMRKLGIRRPTHPGG
jgi:transcriptional regulator with GAF, ATPase, and Fis domain